LGLVRRFKASPALVVACIALLISLTGTSVAAVSQLGRNTVGTPQLKNNAVTTKKVKNGTLVRADFKRGTLLRGAAGPRGLTGAAGAAGAAGAKGDKGDPGNNSLVAFASIDGTPAVPTVLSFGGQGTTGATVTKTCGVGCYDVIFTGSYPGATSSDKVSSFATADTDNFDVASISRNVAPTTTQITVRVFTMALATATVVDRDFAVQVLVP
jgi:hypothetical protein